MVEMSTSLLSFNGNGTCNAGSGWCGASPSSRATSNAININFSSFSRKGNEASVLMPASLNNKPNNVVSKAMSMSLPSTTIISIPQLSCSISLPILCQNSMPNDDYNKSTNIFMMKNNNCRLSTLRDKLENCVDLPQMTGSLPNLKILDHQQQPTSTCKIMTQKRIDSLDLYKNKSKFFQIKSDLTSLKNSENIDNDNSKPKIHRKNSQMKPEIPYFPEQDESNFKKEINHISNVHEEKIQESFQEEEKTGFVVPNKSETVESSESFSIQTECKEDLMNATTTMTPLFLNGDDHPVSNVNHKDNQQEESNDEDEAEDIFDDNYDKDNQQTKVKKKPHLSQCALFFKSGAKNETAAAWLAAATQQISRLNNNNCKQQKVAIRTAYNAQIDLNADQTQINNNIHQNKLNDSEIVDEATNQLTIQRNRRPSILRNHRSKSLDLTNSIRLKKNVRFADTLGFELENIRYFTLPSPQISRRYSYYSSTYLNSDWNKMCWNGILLDKTNFNNVNRTNNGDNDSKTMSDGNLPPRYELTMVNFSNPSLSLDFSKRLNEKNVLLHSLTTAETTIYGTVSVVNIHFVKKVFVRYTFNDWQSHIEREATYMLGSHDGKTDKFSFVIYAQPIDFNNLIDNDNKNSSSDSLNYLNHQSSCCSSSSSLSKQSRMFFAIRYITGDDQEFWDNNDGLDYCLQMKPY